MKSLLSPLPLPPFKKLSLCWRNNPTSVGTCPASLIIHTVRNDISGKQFSFRSFPTRHPQFTSSSSSSPSLSIIWRSFFFSSSVSSCTADSSSLWRPCSRALTCFRRALISSSSSSRGRFVPRLGCSQRNNVSTALLWPSQTAAPTQPGVLRKFGQVA